MSPLALAILVAALHSSAPAPLPGGTAGETRLLALSPPPAAEDAEEAQRWTVTPYFWAPEIEGAVTSRGNRVSGLVPFSEILDHLDLALLLHVERKLSDEGSLLLDGVSM